MTILFLPPYNFNNWKSKAILGNSLSSSLVFLLLVLLSLYLSSHDEASSALSFGNTRSELSPFWTHHWAPLAVIQPSWSSQQVACVPLPAWEERHPYACSFPGEKTTNSSTKLSEHVALPGNFNKGKEKGAEIGVLSKTYHLEHGEGGFGVFFFRFKIKVNNLFWSVKKTDRSRNAN